MTLTALGTSRRRLLQATIGTAFAPLTACASHRHADATPHADFDQVAGFDRTVLRTGPESGPPILLLHELPGMTNEDMGLARLLGQRGFNVYLPLLFGDVGQNSVLSGYLQSCAFGPFDCSGGASRSPILDWLDTASDHIFEATKRPLGVIGMCLTGILPLAMLSPHVDAAVLCQPTLPFTLVAGRPTGTQKYELALGKADLERAQKSQVPFLVMHYRNDDKCPPERISTLRQAFDKRFALIELEGDGHSTLAGSFDRRAFDDTVAYLQVRLGVKPGPLRMTIATFQMKPCAIAAGGWTTVS